MPSISYSRLVFGISEFSCIGLHKFLEAFVTPASNPLRALLVSLDAVTHIFFVGASNAFCIYPEQSICPLSREPAVGMQLRAILLLVALMAIHAATLMFSDGPPSYHSI